MSLAERQFRASVMEALRKYTYEVSRSDVRSTKRRRLDSRCSSLSLVSAAADSGDNSEDEISSNPSPAASEPGTAVKLEPVPEEADNSIGRRRANSGPFPYSCVQADLLWRYLSRIHPADRQRYISTGAPKPTCPVSNPPGGRDADFEIVSAQHQIALARQRLHSYSGPIRGTHADRTAFGGTARPKTACSTTMSTCLCDACSMTSHERNMPSSLVSFQEHSIDQQVQLPIQSPPEKRKAVEQEGHFAGLVMPANFDDDDDDHELEYEPGAYHDETADSGFDDFFKLYQASTWEAENKDL